MSMPPRDGFLHIEDLYKSYGKLLVLDDIDLSVARGELCTVVGPSGCGKSTLLRQILGEERPDSGTITLDGVDVGLPDTRRGIVYQRYGLFPHRSVLENVLLGPRLQAGFWGWRRVAAAARADAMRLLERMRIAEHAHKYPYQLSGGMQQRVSIAQSIIMRPSILLMDEPFGALDPDTREQMQVLLLELWEEQQCTIFLVTHDLEEAVFLGTRILVLSQYYSDDRGALPAGVRGARIVADYALERSAMATDVKHSAGFGELVETIRREGFDPQYTQPVTEFNLHHPHAFQTPSRRPL